MNKQDLISAVADSSGLSKSDASKAVERELDLHHPAETGVFGALFEDAERI